MLLFLLLHFLVFDLFHLLLIIFVILNRLLIDLMFVQLLFQFDYLSFYFVSICLLLLLHWLLLSQPLLLVIVLKFHCFLLMLLYLFRASIKSTIMVITNAIKVIPSLSFIFNIIISLHFFILRNL